MTSLLSQAEFTARLVDKLTGLPIDISVPEALSIKIAYGPGEPVLTIKLAGIYEQYTDTPEKLDVLLTPFLTEIGWTVHEPRRRAQDIAEFTYPTMRDLRRMPFSAEEKQVDAANSKGPLVFQDVIEQADEHVIVQFVMWQNGARIPLRTGDVLPCFPDMRDISLVASENMKRMALESGLTLAEFPVENFKAKPYLVGTRDPANKEFLVSMMLSKDVMENLERSLNAKESIIAIAPAVDQLLIAADPDEASVMEMGLLAQYMKGQAASPVSKHIWRFKGGVLESVQALDSAP